MSRIIGKNIILRELEKDDLLSIHEWTKNSEITDNLSEIFYPPQTLNTTENFVNNVLENKFDNPYFFVIADIKTNKYIGQINFIKINWIHRFAEFGIVIGDVKNHGNGIGKESIKLLLDFGFYKLNLNRIELRVHENNIKAINCYKKCGFIEEGRLRKSFFINNEYTDFILMSIIKDEYKKY